MPDVDRFPRRARSHRDRQAPEVQAAGTVLGRSRSDDQLSRTVQLLVVAFALAAASCSSGLTRDDLVESFLESNPDATADEAGCIVDRLIDEHTLDGVEAELDEPVRSPAFARSRYEAEFLCGRTDDVRNQVLGLLLERELDPADADCIADELTSLLDADDLDVLIDGVMTDEFFEDYFVAVETCDALPE